MHDVFVAVPVPHPGGITVQQLRLYPQRVAKCLAMILAHQQELCAYDTGTLELHYHEVNVTAKHEARWVG